MENFILPDDLEDFFSKSYQFFCEIAAIVIFFYDENCRYSQLQNKIYLKYDKNPSIIIYRADSIYERNLQAAQDLGIEKTPSTIIYNGKLKIHQGFMSVVKFQKELNNPARLCRNCNFMKETEDKIIKCPFHKILPSLFDNCKEFRPKYLFK